MGYKISEYMYYFYGMLAYMGAMLPVTIVCFTFLPAVDTGSEFYKHIYTTERMKTTYFDFAKFVYYILSLALAFTNINVVGLMNRRHDPFADRELDHRAFFKTLGFGSLLFFFSPNFAIQGRKDYTGWDKDCNIGSIDSKSPSLLQEVLTGFVESFLNYTEVVDPHYKCRWYPTLSDVIMYNYLWFSIPLYIGCNFGHLDDIECLRDFNLTWDSMKNWGWKQWTFFVFLILFFIGTFLYFDLEYGVINPHRSYFYYALFAGITGFCVIYSYMHPGYTFHMHHYSLCMILILFIGVQSEYAAACLGVASAVYCDGVAEYNYDPIWYDDYTKKALEEANKKIHPHKQEERLMI